MTRSLEIEKNWNVIPQEILVGLPPSIIWRPPCVTFLRADAIEDVEEAASISVGPPSGGSFQSVVLTP